MKNKKDVHVISASVMEPLNLTREALRVIFGHEVDFVHADVIIERHENIDFGNVKAVREARVKGLVYCLRDRKITPETVEGIFHPYGGLYEHGAIEIRLGLTTYRLTYHRNWVPDPQTSPVTIASPMTINSQMTES